MTHFLPPEPAFGEALSIVPAPAVLDFLARRRSASALTLSAPGPAPEEIEDLIRLSARVPDHGKLAPWRFIILEGVAKTAFIERLEALAQGRSDAVAVAKLGKLKAPPLVIAVVASPKPSPSIPPWEQQMSAGAVCATLLYAALAMGWGANWITDWYAYDGEARGVLGLTDVEAVAGFVMIGTPREPPQERERPVPVVSRWGPR